ncbi:hypothetical protein Hanom_Chr06g00572611 [Helianthus anomalus]
MGHKGEETPSHVEGSSKEAENSQGSLRVKGSIGDEHKDLKSHLARKWKIDPKFSLKRVIPKPRNIRQRLRSASGQKPFSCNQSCGSSKAPIVIHVAPSSFRIKDKGPEISVARITPTFDVSPIRATGTSKPMQLEDPFPLSPRLPCLLNLSLFHMSLSGR